MAAFLVPQIVRTPDPVLEAMSLHPLFQGASTRLLRTLRTAARTRHVATGERLVRQDAAASGFLVLLEGSADVGSRGAPQRRVYASHFGSERLLAGRQRSAVTATATEPGVVLEFGHAGTRWLRVHAPDVVRRALGVETVRPAPVRRGVAVARTA